MLTKGDSIGAIHCLGKNKFTVIEGDAWEDGASFKTFKQAAIYRLEQLREKKKEIQDEIDEILKESGSGT